jgi:hypothetical protein
VFCSLAGIYSLGYDQEAGRRKEYRRSLLLTCPEGQVATGLSDMASRVFRSNRAIPYEEIIRERRIPGSRRRPERLWARG